MAESAITAPAADQTNATESSTTSVSASGLDAVIDGDLSGLPAPLVDVDELRAGGPPPDGIPPIDDPVFVATDEVDYLADNEPVLAFELNGDARAYPVQIMTWHEIVNDTVGGEPVSLTYCPLCNSAIAYDRRLPEGAHETLGIVDFGTSGMLWNSALVMFDRQTETLWSHFTGEGIVGELTGVELDTYPVSTVAWSTWRDAHPDGLVLSRDTGFDRDYGRNPYPGYDDVDGTPFLFEGEVDGRFTAMTRVVGIEFGDDALAVPLTALEQTGVVTSDGLTFWWVPGTASPLDSDQITAGRDVGQTAVYVASVPGFDRLRFSANGDGTFTDDQTESTWNLFGEAIDGELVGRRLESVEHVDTFWFAWSTFLPDTEIESG